MLMLQLGFPFSIIGLHVSCNYVYAAAGEGNSVDDDDAINNHNDSDIIMIWW